MIPTDLSTQRFPSLWKVCKFAFITLVTLIFSVYAVLAGLLWWGEQESSSPETREDPVYVRSLEPHRMELLNDGLLSLDRRIELIEGARQSIDLEFFIYELDTAARIITAKLVEAAKRGAKVRLLVDFAAPVFKLGPHYAGVLEKNGVEVRYYNSASLLRIFSSQHRSHRKLLIIDGQQAITGDRNIANDYFNLSEHCNFLDSDIIVDDPAVESFSASFMHYWQSPLATPAADMDAPAGDFDKNFHVASPEIIALIERIKSEAAKTIAQCKQHVCNDVVFVTDYSGTFAHNRQVYKRLQEFLQEAQSEVVGESPYFVLRQDGMNLLRNLSERGIKQVYLTNGLSSTDAWYTVSGMSFSLSALKQANIDVRLFNGSHPEKPITATENVPDRWGIHAKRAVVDRKHILIGTYNVDPRSANFNSELMLICRNNPDLANELLLNINSHIAGSRQLLNAAKSPLASLLKDSDTGQVTRFFLGLPLVYLFDFLL
jgi:putative cardiolipin synthase